MPTKPDQEADLLKLRPASQVMRLARMGSFHQSRLSFMRVLLRRLKQENWTFDRPIWRIDENGVGVATYSATGPERTYTLIAFAHDLPDELRSDRVIAEAWDATFTLFDGVPTDADIERLRENVPLQEAGRLTGDELVLSRANRSVRLFQYVKDCLANGDQPDAEVIEPVGYLMRTTAVYGSGKFGAADRERWADRPEFAGSFQPELLSVWLIRAFTIDLVEHMARMAAPDKAVTINDELRRRFGVGNSTGLGMAPFLLNHPSLVHAWIDARETALARVRALERADQAGRSTFNDVVRRAQINAENWTSEHPLQIEKVRELRSDLTKLATHLENFDFTTARPWDALFRWVEDSLGVEGQEQVVSLLLEPYGALIDDLAETMCANEHERFRINGGVKIGLIKAQLSECYGWANRIDFDQPKAIARVWYVSEEKLEPRLGERFEEPIEPYEQPLSPGRDARRMMADLETWDDQDTLGRFLMRHPEHRHTARRLHLTQALPYAEINDNTIDAHLLPIDLLRCKLSFFGATRFDPRSDRWVRITMFQGAPFPNELGQLDPDDLAYPPVGV